MSQEPHDQLLLQIRGAVAAYERTLLCERMRRDRLAKLRAGQPLPWSRPLVGYRLDLDHPRDPAGLQFEPSTTAVVQQMFAWYREPGVTIHAVALRLTQAGVPTATGKPRWNGARVRGMLQHPAYAGTAYVNRARVVPAVQRKSALLPARRPRPELPLAPTRRVDPRAGPSPGLPRHLRPGAGQAGPQPAR